MTPLLETALAALRAGLSVHPPMEDGSKAPLPFYPNGVDEQGRPKKTWLHPPGQPPDEATLRRWFGKRRGIGVRTGTASGGLECLEFDQPETYRSHREAAAACGLADLVTRIEAGYREETPGGGVHWLYFTAEVRGNTKLAKEPAPTADTPHKVLTLIETRGENGFVIVAPSGGPVHPSGRPYVLTAGGFDSIATITSEEREALWELARSFDRMPRPAAEVRPAGTPRTGARGTRPGEAFEQQVSWAEILEPAGWTLASRRGEAEYWRRPEKSIGVSATTNHGGSGLLWVFSSSTPFDSEKSYTKFGAVAILEHGGDHSAAARALREQGYGDDRASGRKADDTRAPAAPEVEIEWQPPRLSEVPSAPPFPVAVFPKPVASLVRSIADSVVCPPDFAGLAALIVAGAAIGRSATLMIKPGYFAPAALYGMNIGNPTSGKTPSLKAIVAPLAEINAEHLERYLVALDQYEEEEEAWQRAPKNAKPARPLKPRLETIVLNDCTTEVAKARLAENSRGLLAAYDEGGAWVGSLNQYRSGKGTDRQFFLSALYGTPIRIDRMKDRDRPTSIRHPFLAIVGNMTPETLGDLREPEGRSDGTIERMVFAFPEPMPRRYWSDEGLDPSLGDGWRLIIQRLLGRPLALNDGREVPHVVRFSPEAKAIWVEWYDANVRESRGPDYQPSELAVDGKLEDFAARIALVLHMLALASVPDFHPGDDIPPLSAEAMRGAIELWRYFRAHHRRARWQMDGGVENRDARLVLDWIRRHSAATFSRKKLTDHLRWLAERPGGPDEILDWLEERHILRRCSAPPREPGQRGQPPSPTFEVNPSILASRNSQNSQNSVQRIVGGNSANSANSANAPESESDPDEGEATWTV